MRESVETQGGTSTGAWRIDRVEEAVSGSEGILGIVRRDRADRIETGHIETLAWRSITPRVGFLNLGCLRAIMAGEASYGVAGSGGAWQARLGVSRLGEARQRRRGMPRQGLEGHGQVWLGSAGTVLRGEFTNSTARAVRRSRQAGHGMVRRGLVRRRPSCHHP